MTAKSNKEISRELLLMWPIAADRVVVLRGVNSAGLSSTQAGFLFLQCVENEYCERGD